MDDKKVDGLEKNDKTNVSVDNNSVNNKSSDKAGSYWQIWQITLLQCSEQYSTVKYVRAHIQIFNIISLFLFFIYLFIYLGNTKGTTNSSKSNDDNEKNAKKSNDDTVGPGQGTSLGEIPKIEKYIANTRIDGLQTLYQVHNCLHWYLS